MKPLDEEQSAVFQKAIDHHTREANKEAQSGSEIGEKIHSACVAALNAALKELRPKPKFADGQLVYCDGPSYFGWYKVGNNPDEHGILEQSRPLNFTELGPEVMALRDAAIYFHDKVLNWVASDDADVLYRDERMLDEMMRMARVADALKALDAAHGGNDETD